MAGGGYADLAAGRVASCSRCGLYLLQLPYAPQNKTACFPISPLLFVLLPVTTTTSFVASVCHVLEATGFSINLKSFYGSQPPALTVVLLRGPQLRGKLRPRRLKSPRDNELLSRCERATAASSRLDPLVDAYDECSAVAPNTRVCEFSEYSIWLQSDLLQYSSQCREKLQSLTLGFVKWRRDAISSCSEAVHLPRYRRLIL